MKTYFGQFIWVSDCTCPDFVTDEGEVIAHIDISRYPDGPPLEEHLSATLDSNVLIEYRRDQSVAAAPSSTHSRVALAYVKSSFDDDDQAFIDKRAKQLQDSYNRALQGHRTLEVKGFLVPLEDNMRVDLNDRTLFRAIDAASGNEFTHFHAVGGSRSGYCGIARMNSNRAITFTPWQCFPPTDFHEHGHNAGLHHSGRNGVEYGESNRIMGSGRGRQWLNAPHLYHLGGLDENHVAEFLSGEDGHAFLVGFNTLELAVPSGADRMLHLRQAGAHRMVAVSLDGDHLDVHVPFSDYSRSWSKTNHVATIRSGGSAVVAGRHIFFEEYRDGVASVVIDHESNRSAWPEYPPVDTIGFDDCAGLWGNPQWGAQGVHVMPASDGKVWVAWLTWDYNYNPIWFAGDLTIREGVASGRIGNGSEQVTAAMMFTDAANGIFRARFDDGELLATPLKRVSRAKSSDVAALDGGRFRTSELADNKAGVVFGYNLYPKEVTHIRRWPPRWELREDGTVYRYSGGMRGVKAKVEKEVVGE